MKSLRIQKQWWQSIKTISSLPPAPTFPSISFLSADHLMSYFTGKSEAIRTTSSSHHQSTKPLVFISVRSFQFQQINSPASTEAPTPNYLDLYPIPSCILQVFEPVVYSFFSPAVSHFPFLLIMYIIKKYKITPLTSLPFPFPCFYL